MQEILAARRLTLFTFLFAGAIVFHQSKLGDWEVFSHHAVLVLVALWTMLRPSSMQRLLVLLGVHFVTIVMDLPLVVNHWLLVGMAELGLFIALGVGRLRGSAWATDRGALHLALEPYLRLQVVFIYFFAALAKVNSAFLDADLSCGVAMVDELFARSPVKPGGSLVDQSAIWGTILIELALPILLSMRRTRLAAIFLGGGFHIILALSGHLPFSGFALAFYALFVPDDLPSRWDLVRAARLSLDRAFKQAIAFGHSKLAFPLVGGGFLALAAGATYVDGRFETAGYGLAFLVYLVLNLLAGAALLACVWGNLRVEYAPHPLRLASPVWVIGPALVFLNALTPYLGLKTQNSWTMYSNLQTEPGRWNHSLIPEDVRVFGLQDDRVRIVSSSDEDLQEAADEGWEWSLWALRQKAQRDEDFAVTYVSDGRQTVVRSAADELEPLNPVIAKLWMMRDVPAAGDNECRVRRGSGPNQGS